MKHLKVLSLMLTTIFTINLTFATCDQDYIDRVTAIEENDTYIDSSVPERTFLQVSALTASVVYANKWAAAAVASGHAHYLMINPEIVPVLTGIISTVVVLDKLKGSQLIRERENHLDMITLLQQSRDGFGVTLEAMNSNLMSKGLNLDLDELSSQILELNTNRSLCPINGQLSTVYGLESTILENNGIDHKKARIQ